MIRGSRGREEEREKRRKNAARWGRRNWYLMDLKYPFRRGQRLSQFSATKTK